MEGVHGGKGRSWSCRRRGPGLRGRGTPLGDGPLDVIGSVRPLDLALDFGRTPPGLAASPRLCSERPQGSLQAQHRDSGQKSKPARGGGTQSHGRKGVSQCNPRGAWSSMHKAAASEVWPCSALCGAGPVTQDPYHPLTRGKALESVFSSPLLVLKC